MNDLVSIIVPVYNVEPYVKRCVESLWEQTYQNIEIILVDDCSTDNSLEVCKHLQETGRNILPVLHHECNEGQEGTRNSGIEAASGQWVMFLDSDDTYTPNAVEKMVEFASVNDCDMVFAPYNSIKNGAVEVRKATIAEFAGTREDFAKHCLIDIPFDVLSCVGAKIYRKRLLDDRHIRFDRTYKYNEDAAFMATSLSKAGRVGYLDLPYYNYIRRDSNSIQSSYRPHMFLSIQKSRAITRKFLEDNQAYSGERKRIFDSAQISLAFESLYNEASFASYDEFKKEFDDIRTSDAYKSFQDEYSICGYKQRLMLHFLKLNMARAYYLLNKAVINYRKRGK